VERLGDLGKKIHTGRSRNDQVLTALRLFTRRRILSVGRRVHTFASRLLRLAEAGVRVPMRGYTHTRPAMPTTVAVWLGSFVETLLDDVTLLRTAHAVNDQNPLGSAAGYGSPIELDRELTRELLGFERIQINALYCQNSRGKVEGTALHALASIQDSLAKLATDLIQFSTEEYGFVSLPDELTTGSSIMPQKRNPDVLELVRAKAGVVTGAIVQVRGIASGLGSGYHRDFQLVKEPLITSFAVVEASLEVMERMMEGIVLNEGAMAASCTREIYAADVALEKSRSGVPFRDAYRMAMAELDGLVIDEAFIAGRIDAYRTIGSMGNPCLDAYVEPLNDFAGWLKQREEQITAMEQRLRQPVS
jgi:argininosuccinate lyase